MSFAHPPGDVAHGALDAWDPLTGKKKWTVWDKYPRISTVLSTKGGLVFSGDMKGYIYAYDADTGQELWKFNMGSACGAAIAMVPRGEVSRPLLCGTAPTSLPMRSMRQFILAASGREN